MAKFVAKAKELGFTYVEADASVSPQESDELIKASVPISSVHSPCLAALSSKDVLASLTTGPTKGRRELGCGN